MGVAITVDFPWISATRGRFSSKSRKPWAARTRCAIWPTSINIASKSSWNAARKRDEMLEPYEWKRSRTVLRRESGSNPADLVDTIHVVEADYRYDLTDISSTLLDTFRECGICLNDLEMKLKEESVVYGSEVNESFSD